MTRKSGSLPRPFTALGLTLAAVGLGLSCDGGGTVELAGIVERKALELAAPSSEVITELPVAEGGRVAAGGVVVQLDTAVAEAELRAHEAGRAAAQAWLNEAERELGRQSDLKKSKVVPQRAYDIARRLRDEALAQVAEKEARIAQATKRLDDLTLRAHAGGVVDQLPFELGERVPAGGVVAVVTADEAPWVRVWMPARVVLRLPLGSAVDVHVEGLAEALPGKVIYIARESEFTPHYALTERESAHLVYEAHITLGAAPEALRPGLPARVRLRPEAE